MHIPAAAGRFLRCTNGVTTIEFTFFAAALTLALGVFVVPFLSQVSSNPETRFAFQPNTEIDGVVTGTVRPSNASKIEDDGKRVLSITRSVLQGPNDPPCIVFVDGTSNGYC